jgi:hypothetical protein
VAEEEVQADGVGREGPEVEAEEDGGEDVSMITVEEEAPVIAVSRDQFRLLDIRDILLLRPM